MMQQYHNRARKDAEIRNRPAGLIQRKFLIFFMLCVFLPAAISLHAGGSLEITNVETPQTITYSNSTASQTNTVTVEFRRGYLETSANSFLTFSSGSSGTSVPWRIQIKEQGVTLNYQIYDNLTDKHILKNLSDEGIGQNNILTHYFSGSDEFTFQYSLEIPENQHSVGGTYQDIVTVNLYSGDLNNNRMRDSEEITFTTTVPIAAELAVVRAGEPFNFNSTSLNLDFGFLAGGETMAFDILVQANTHFDIKVQSQEGGSLAPVSLAGDPSRINYFLDFGDSVFDLGTEQITVLQNADPVFLDINPDDARIPVIVEIAEFDWPTSGEYQDTLTFTLQTE